jgi:PPOX class probable F420-dependent enzyme
MKRLITGSQTRFLEMVKLDRKAIDLLKGKNFAFIATINPDGSPQVTPVWVDTDGSKILVNSALGRVKVKNLLRDSRVALAVSDANNPYFFLSFDGKVVQKFTGKKADDHIDFLSFKYTGNKKYQGRKAKEKRILFVIEPIHVRTW